MPPKIKTRAVNTLLHGWGYVEGRWVYVPLWDPPREYGAFRYLQAGAALADAAMLVSSKGVAEKLRSVAGSLVNKATAGFTKAWEDGDPICPPWPPFPKRPPWPPFPFPWPPIPFPGPGPDPGPDPYAIHQFIEDLSPLARNAVVGHLVSTIGEILGDRSVIEVGKEVIMTR